MPATERRRRQDDDDEMDEDAPPRQRQNRGSVDPESDEEANDTSFSANSANDQLAKNMIRYVLSCECSRTPIRRDGIKERVLTNHGRAFRRVFVLAQEQLRAVWGMELRELPVREKMTLHEKRQAMKNNSQPKTGSGTYILCSTLPPKYRTEKILKPAKVPSEVQEATYMGFCTLVVATIWLSGGELADQRLMRNLARLNAERNVWSEKTELTLKRMERQGYVVKKVEKPPLGHDGDQIITWHVGPRSKEEIGLDGVMGMVREVYGSFDGNEEFEKKLRESLGLKRAAADDRQ